ncbi:MAG: polymorphic toxin type 44 domain-containing protein [Chloroflexi bacterium]|nr:polymorphic toxin type 44 domain-containing protein [Chloroflexota bacterium]
MDVGVIPSYADWLEKYYSSLPLQYTYNNVITDPPNFRVTETSPFCNDSWLARRNLTSWLVNQMNINAAGDTSQTIRNLKQNNPDGWIAANLMWTMMVRGGAPWDFKPDIRREIGGEIILADTWYSYDVPANIHYGYVALCNRI